MSQDMCIQIDSKLPLLIQHAVRTMTIQTGMESLLITYDWLIALDSADLTTL